MYLVAVNVILNLSIQISSESVWNIRRGDRRATQSWHCERRQVELPPGQGAKCFYGVTGFSISRYHLQDGSWVPWELWEEVSESPDSTTINNPILSSFVRMMVQSSACSLHLSSCALSYDLERWHRLRWKRAFCTCTSQHLFVPPPEFCSRSVRLNDSLGTNREILWMAIFVQSRRADKSS